MKHSIKNTFFLFFTLLCALSTQAQDSKWMKIQSDSGELALEFPTEYHHVYDKDGFLATRDHIDYSFKKIHLLNAFLEDTLLSVDIFETEPEAVKTLYQESDVKSLSGIKLGNNSYAQSTVNKDEYYLKVLYLYSKEHVYVVTAASRKGKTAAMKRFFDSLEFNPDSKSAAQNATIVSALERSVVDIKTNIKKDLPDNSENLPKENNNEKEKNSGKLMILYRPRSGYPESARKYKEEGIIILTAEFSKNGYISKIEVNKKLGEGLLHQSIIAALRTKFLPEQANGEVQTVTKKLQYQFTLY